MLRHDTPQIIYPARGRLHRSSRASLIQVTHTVQALGRIGVAVTLELPPSPVASDLQAALAPLGIEDELDIRCRQSLHPRFRFHPYVWWHRRRLAAAAARYTRVPELALAMVRHGLDCHLEVHDTPRLVETGQIDAVVAGHRDGVILTLLPLTEAAGRRLVEHGADPDRVHANPSGVHVEGFERVTPFDPASLDAPRVVYLGGITESRGLGILRHLAGAGIDVTVVGGLKPGVELGKLKRHPRVPHREVPDWYSKASLCVLPYPPSAGHSESTSPMKLMESLAAGRPIITSDLPPIREAVTHEEHALLVNPADPDAWLAAIRRLQDERDLASRLAAAAKQRAAHFSWTSRARRIADWLGLSR